MSLYKRKDSSHRWVKITHNGRSIQGSTGTEIKQQAQEYPLRRALPVSIDVKEGTVRLMRSSLMMPRESIEIVVSPSTIPCGNHQPLRMAVFSFA
jgi:hypothetical protein